MASRWDPRVSALMIDHIFFLTFVLISLPRSLRAQEREIKLTYKKSQEKDVIDHEGQARG